MKERGGPHLVGQQMISYMSPQEYVSGKLSSDLLGTNIKPVAPFSNLPANSSTSLSLNVVQFPPPLQPQQQLNKKKGPHGGSGTGGGNSNSEQRQMNLAEMVRSSNIMKQSSFTKKEGFPPIASNPSSSIQPNEFIKGTQFSKDFQLIAEPLIPKSSAGGANFLPPSLSHNGSNNLKGGVQSTSSSQITYSNTAISSNQDKYDNVPISSGAVSGNHFSHTSSRKNLDGNYNGGGKVSNFTEFQQSLSNAAAGGQQALQHMLLQQNNQLYSTNRSVAAKAGQMQVLGTDKYSQLASNSSQGNTKYQSPAKPSAQAPGSKHLHHSSASQQLDNMMDLQQLKARSQNSNTNKYTDYLNRFSTGSNTIDNTQNLQMKYRDLREGEDQPIGGSQKYTQYQIDQALAEQSDNAPSHSFNMANNKKASPISQGQKENRMAGLGISGEQMHLEEKTFLKKMAIMAVNSIENTAAPVSHRQGGSSRKRQEFQLNPRGYNNRGYRPGEQPLAMQPKTRYDYVFIRMTDEQFEKDFADKIYFSRESIDDQSPSQLSFKNKRLSSMANTNAVGAQGDNEEIQKSAEGLSVPARKNMRGSQDLSNRDTNFFSPQYKHSEDQQPHISIQNHQPESSVKGHPATPKATTNVCSIISTNHTHIKVIANQGLIAGFNGLTLEQKSIQQQALNDCVQDVMMKVQEKGRIVKTTFKRKYVVNALNPANMRVASIFVIVLDNSLGYQGEIPQVSNIVAVLGNELRNTLRSDSSASSGNFNSTLSHIKSTKVAPKQVLKKEESSIKDQLSNGKSNMRMRNNSTMNTKGYESESEVKSTNSTTASSTLQHFIPTRNFEQNQGSNTTKNSSRSLSQKGTQPRKNFQKKQDARDSNKDGDEPTSLTPFLVLKDPNAKKYPPTKIKILSPFDYTHHESHRINICLNNYNNFIALCFKNKGKINVNAVMKLGRQIGVPVSQSMFNDGFIKSREVANMLKEKLIAYLCKIINEENTPDNMPDNPLLQEAIVPLNQPVHQYKCYVGKGNNSILIRTLFKTRFWWLLHDKEEIEKVNFMWTQLRKNQIMDSFPCKFEDKKSTLKSHNPVQNTPSLQTPGKMKSKKKISMQVSNLSLESSGGGSNDKKESRLEQINNREPAPVMNQVSQALQQLSVKLYNKLEDNFHLSNKKAMFLNIRLYYEAMGKDVFNAVPMTFHIKDGLEDPEFSRFKAYYMKEEEEIRKQKHAKNQVTNGEATEEASQLANASLRRNIWIVKPGENTNRGQGITVLKDLDEIKSLIQESTASKKRTCIVQKYIHNPLLINKRKFDIRLYAFMSSINGNIKGYFYADGYLRTSCREFTLQNLSNRMIHLTNDAVQKYAEDYGKYEAGNKLSYIDFQNYLDKNYADLNISFERDLLPQMKKLVTDTFRAVYGKIDPKRRVNTFEIYGYDFMFDDDFKVYLIEVNTNPCLELGCPLLARLIPTMVENALRLSIDPLFPPPENWSQKKCVVNDICPENKFELIFDEKIDGATLTDLMKEKNNIIIEIDEEELSDDEVEDKDECAVDFGII